MGRLAPALVGLALLAAASAPASAQCLGGGAGTLPAPAVQFLRSYRAELGAPARVAMDSAGNIFVTDPPRGEVLGRALDGSIIARIGGLGNPVAIALDDAGRIFVGDANSGTVAAFSWTGVRLFELGQGAGEFLLPADMAFDASTGELFVADARDHRVKVYGPTGAFLRSFGGPESGEGELNFPAGIFVDGAADEVLVVDHMNFRVAGFDRSGAYQFCLGYRRDSVFSPRRDLNMPQGVWVDGGGRVYIADAVDGVVKVLDREGALLTSIGGLGSGPGQLRVPMDVLIDSFGRLFVTSATNGRIEIFGLDTYTDPEAVIPAKVEIQPDPLDRWVPPDAIVAFIEVPGYPLEAVAAASVVADGVVAQAVSIGDNDGDAIPDLRVEFDYQAFHDSLPAWGSVGFSVTGQLGSLEFRAADTVEMVAYPCADGLDNDGDGFTDLADPGCKDESPRSTENPQCDDGIDNDGDGFIDLADPNCGQPYKDRETAWWACGLGFELILIAPLLVRLRSRRRRRLPVRLALVLMAAALCATARPAAALDPAHDVSNSIDCGNCHLPHGAAGGAITRVEGNSNLCMSCHTFGGLATNRPFTDADQALPGQSGTSHRWDSGPSGHVEASLANTSTGEVLSGGAFTGRIERVYTITITSGGDAGSATFDWMDDVGVGGSATTGIDVPLNAGLTLSFSDAAVSPAFVTGDQWTLYVRTDLRLPDPADAFEQPMASRVADGKVVCSVCHDQHSQLMTPFDPAAPAYGGSGTGWGRHFQRQDNDVNQMCKVCHEARDVTSSALGSHPVGLTIPAGDFQTPATLPLDWRGEVQCLSCHSPHFSDSGGANGGLGNGYILRQSMRDVCFECHTLADGSAGSHFDPGTGALWPGGQYGSTLPAHNAEDRGACVNCHWPHGWPDDANMSQDYPRLWNERYDLADDGSDPDDAEDLCFTCHDGDPAATDIRGEFAKGTNGASIFHHPVADSEQTVGRSVECVDCHNPHRARSDDKLAGVAGVDLAGDPVGPGTANDRAIEQQELCFKCHGDTFNATRPETTNKRLDFQLSNSAFHPVAGPGQNQSTNLANGLRGGLDTSSTILCSDCHNNEATADANGPASNSSSLPDGPHGSAFAAIRRDNYWTNLTGPGNWNRNNFALCFLCHDPARLVVARDWGDGAATNFYDDIDGRDNLHWVHLEDRPGDTRATCKNCHFNVHSNRSAGNTQYRIDGVVHTTPPTNVKTHLVDFSPDILPIGGRARPEWEINTGNRRRRCYLSCHGETMNGMVYRPGNGGDDTPTIP